jgi:N1221-like protein
LTGDDSLSLQQLRRLVNDGGIFTSAPEPTPYAFEYSDAARLPEELEEWFSYGIEERGRIAKSQASFVGRWTRWNGNTFGGSNGGEFDWVNAVEPRRRDFMKDVLAGLKETDLDRRLKELETLVYVVLGVWHETAGLPSTEERTLDLSESKDEEESELDLKQESIAEDTYEKSGYQIDWIRTNTEMLLDCDGLQPILDLVKSTTERAW